MFGYACRETPQLMPLPITLAHELMQHLTQLRKDEKIPYLRPDAKSQVSCRVRRRSARASRGRGPLNPTRPRGQSRTEIKKDMIEQVIKEVIPAHLLDERTQYHVNPTGRFVIGGPHGDCGLTGRKIIVDTYGGACPHGGGAFSGKDPSKVDRSAHYMARYVAKNVVAARLAARCQVQLAYAIGVGRAPYRCGSIPLARASRPTRRSPRLWKRSFT